MSCQQALRLVVEDDLSEAVLRRLLRESARNFTVDGCLVAGGIVKIRKKFPAYINASHVQPHIVLVDLDRIACPGELLQQWRATSLPSRMLLRVAVRQVEAWLLADREGVAAFLHIDKRKAPLQPEDEQDAKAKLVSLARKSRKRRLAREIAPAPGNPARVGVMYNPHLIQFVRNHWNVEAARATSPSLERCLQRIAGFLMAATKQTASRDINKKTVQKKRPDDKQR